MSNQGIGTWPARRRRSAPEHTAIVFEDTEISYRELDSRVVRLADALAARGLRAGDRLAYLGENHPSFIVTVFACALLGAVFVPLNTRLAVPELRFALADSGSVLLVHSSALTEVAERSAEGTTATRLLVAEQLASLPGAAGAAPGAAVSLQDPAAILYTSGTTGHPKGAVLTHGNLTWNALNVLVDYDISREDRVLLVSPMFHVASLGMGALPAILKGATVVLERRFDPVRALRLIESRRITWMSGVPTTFQMLTEHPDWATTDLGSLRRLTCGGSAAPHRVTAAFEARGLAFTGGYGMTEAAPGVTALTAERSAQGAPHADPSDSVGVPHFFTEVEIDPLSTPAGEDGTGEILVRGPNVIPHYWNSPAQTAEAFTPDGWFRTGDLGRLREDGSLELRGRVKDMIISGGENIYAAEVEQLLLDHPAVDSAAVIGIPDERWGEVPVAVVVPRGTVTLSQTDVAAHLAGRLARYKIPTRVVCVDELPRTASGKIVKTGLGSLFEPGMADGG